MAPRTCCSTCPGLGGDDPAPGKPTAAFTADCSQSEPSCAFDASGSTDPDPDGDIASYAWDFGDGDGGKDTGVTASHRYPAAQQNLTVTDRTGHADTASRTVQCRSFGLCFAG
ncbi:PKD domain-containing protein [Streptomyces sp. NPDC058534]|uniref:PKD domain-containing protein n=1 Tax=Streptomyces sp. NPDC058534 TaxID=3346541 RepID=UPI00366196BF